ncbi:hypothetical protein AVEN_233053-1, partial [Araneus ventricosus]
MDTKVEISLDNNDDETYIFCPHHSYRDPLILKGEFTVTHYITGSYSLLKSEFSLTYEIDEGNTEPAGESAASSSASEEPSVPGTTEELVSSETSVNCSE